jgi:hypothetical protein
LDFLLYPKTNFSLYLLCLDFQSDLKHIRKSSIFGFFCFGYFDPKSKNAILKSASFFGF